MNPAVNTRNYTALIVLMGLCGVNVSGSAAHTEQVINSFGIQSNGN